MLVAMSTLMGILALGAFLLIVAIGTTAAIFLTRWATKDWSDDMRKFWIASEIYHSVVDKDDLTNKDGK